MTTILIVDDDAPTRTLVRITVEVARAGLSIVGEAVDGTDALRVWNLLEDPPDVILLDHRMPHLTGLDVAKQILEERPGQRIVLYTAYAEDIRAEAAELGVAATVSKDDIFSLPQLIRSLG